MGVLARFVEDKSTVSEVWSDVGQPAVDDVPFGALLPLHYVDDLLWALDFFLYVVQVLSEVKVLVNHYTQVFI